MFAYVYGQPNDFVHDVQNGAPKLLRAMRYRAASIYIFIICHDLLALSNALRRKKGHRISNSMVFYFLFVRLRLMACALYRYFGAVGRCTAQHIAAANISMLKFICVLFYII